MRKKIIIVDDYTDKMNMADTIRDEEDKTIYKTAIKANCDAILTGDKDFIENNNLDILILKVDDFIK